MSITDELREWAKALTHWWYDPVKNEYTYTTGGMPTSIDAIRLDSNIIAIADRIDAEHESACAEAYGNGVMSVPVALDESAWVELPKDADGEYIHVGDVMEERSGHTFEVASLMAFGGSDNWLVLSDTRNFSSFREPHDLRHHHAPTVEDVLREFADEMNQNLGMYTGEAIDADEWRDADNKTISEYAKRLTLAEGEDA